MESKIQELSKKKALTKEEVADSWEDDALSDSSLENEGHEQEEQVTKKPNATKKSPERLSMPKAQPPTFLSPRPNAPDWSSQGPSDFREARRRPEKSTAVAGRLIAGALGVKAPKKTEEQRAYERSIKEQEIRRRNREKEQHEKERLEDEKAKESVWDG